MKRRPLDPFRRALLRGLGVLLPPLLTIVILLWAWNTIATYMLVPMEGVVRRVLVAQYEKEILTEAEVRRAAPGEATVAAGRALVDGRPYRRTKDGDYIPSEHYDVVEAHYGPVAMPSTARDAYRAFVDVTYLPRHIVVPVFLCVFLLLLYLLGKFIAAGIGRFFWAQFERLIVRLPLVRNVYTSVKQVTDFVFSEQELQYTRVVAIEYPRRGVWALAFVTGESLIDIAAAANEPVLAVLVPTSPMPFTGFTATVKRSETLDLNITMEQALQFIVSCGVVAPPNEVNRALAERERQSLAALPPTDALPKAEA